MQAEERFEDYFRAMTARCILMGASVDTLVADWDDYFKHLQIAPDRQIQEFEGIMRVRVYNGSTSLRAPDVTRELARGEEPYAG